MAHLMFASQVSFGRSDTEKWLRKKEKSRLLRLHGLEFSSLITQEYTYEYVCIIAKPAHKVRLSSDLHAKTLCRIVFL